ncbi:MAG: hypothetical protein ACREMX_02940 [Gemmatimonadales bacterium]
MPLLLVLQAGMADTVRIRAIDRPPSASAPADSAGLGPPTVRLRTGQGTASLWLVRAADSVFLLASIADSTYYWGDDLVISFDVAGEGGASPQLDHFQWCFRRALDSSVVLRGKAGRWAPPRGDPDWRLRRERSGAGWEVSATNREDGWTLRLGLDPGWFTGREDKRPRIAFQIYDDAPHGWFTWPDPRTPAGATLVERTPALWVPVE